MKTIEEIYKETMTKKELLTLIMETIMLIYKDAKEMEVDKFEPEYYEGYAEGLRGANVDYLYSLLEDLLGKGKIKDDYFLSYYWSDLEELIKNE